MIDPSQVPIPLEEIARFPAPGTATPAQITIAPNGAVLTYLYSPEGSLERRLFALDLRPSCQDQEPFEVHLGGTGASEGELSLQERLRRERAREVGLGVTSATWAENADALLVPLQDGIYVVRGLSTDPSAYRAERVVRSAEGEILQPRLSPDGTLVAFVRDGELFVATAEADAAVRQLSHSATPGVSNGLAEYVAQEEMGRGEGFWWSPDSTMLAFAEVDERHIPPYRIVHQGSDEVGPNAEEAHRYPFAGASNVSIRLGSMPISGSETTWMDTGNEEYLVRVHWTVANTIVAEVAARDQKSLRLVGCDPGSGAATSLHLETANTFLNMRDDYRALGNGTWLWSSERTGFRHLEVHAEDGTLLRVLTKGEWQVDRVEAIDEIVGRVYFSATRDGPTERHLYTVALEGGIISRLTPEAGTHIVVVSSKAGLFVDRYASLATPPVVTLRSLTDGSVRRTIHDRRDPRIDELGLVAPELLELEADDGTPLFGLYYAPTPPSSAPPPLVVAVYGGPEVQLVTDDWAPTVALRAQALRRLGFAVLVVDNRGSSRRGVAFEGAIYRRLGGPEVADQVRAVRWATERGLGDPQRVGIYGWSYGGYMALSCAAKEPGIFRSAIAGAPVTSWDGYDTFYSERYMGIPSDHEEGYFASSVLTHVASIEAELLIVHGLLDENVHFRHTARLVNALVRSGIEHELLCFPDERHLPRALQDRAYLERRVQSFLMRTLKP